MIFKIPRSAKTDLVEVKYSPIAAIITVCADFILYIREKSFHDLSDLFDGFK